MRAIASDQQPHPFATQLLKAFDCPAILVSADYEILAANEHYRRAFGAIDFAAQPRCFRVSHGYTQPCDRSGESCPLIAAKTSGKREKVLHIHQTPRGPEHVDVELIPLHDDRGDLSCFIELLRPVPLAGGPHDKIMVGQSAAFNQLLRDISRVGRTNAAVLLLGESGTGKELAAKAVHLASDRSAKPLVTLECAGLTDTLFESELFGHVKGAFTGALANKQGLVELAHGGTLFLDEIGDVPLSMQVKLLRLLETGTFRPVGASEIRRTDFRLICATHKDLPAMVEQGEFREDLFYRINVFPISMPALRARSEDIPLIIKSMLARMSPTKKYHVTEAAVKRLKAHDYRGNIRELRNILQRVLIFAESNLIELESVEQALARDGVSTPMNDVRNAKQWQDLKSAEREYLGELLRVFDGDKERVATVAGISLRSLYRKLQS